MGSPIRLSTSCCARLLVRIRGVSAVAMNVTVGYTRQRVNSARGRIVTTMHWDHARVGRLVLAQVQRTLTLGLGMTDIERKHRIAFAIRSAREVRGFSRPQLAALVGVSRGAVSDWENAETLPGLLNLGPLCDALGVDPDLFAHPPEIPVSPVRRYLQDPDPPKDSEAAV